VCVLIQQVYADLHVKHGVATRLVLKGSVPNQLDLDLRPYVIALHQVSSWEDTLNSISTLDTIIPLPVLASLSEQLQRLLPAPR